MTTANDSIAVTPGAGALVATNTPPDLKEYQTVVIAGSNGHVNGTKPTYSYIVPSTAVAASKLFLDIFNAVGSGKVMKIVSVRPIMDVDASVTGVVGVRLLMFRTNTVGTGGTPWNYQSPTLDVAGGTVGPHDTANAALPAQITGRHLPTGGATITDWVRGMYAIGVVTSTSLAYKFQGQFNMLDLDDTTAQLFTVREGEGILIKQGLVAATTANVRFRVTFTLE